MCFCMLVCVCVCVFGFVCQVNELGMCEMKC